MSVYRVFLNTQQEGGFLMWIIFIVAIVAWFIGVDKLFRLNHFARSRVRFLRVVDALISGKNISATGHPEFDLLARFIGQCVEGKGCVAFEPRFRQFLICTIPELNKGFSTMNAWISVAPLLGLLGTVLGMIETFKIITIFGVGNPNLTAQGISVAMLTTQAGLTVAFPAVLMHNFLANRKNQIVNRLLKDGEMLLSRLGAPGAASTANGVEA
jgi:biopolymer transport protein ExbB